jgi:VWFA-related protein
VFARVLLTVFVLISILCAAIARQPQPSPQPQKPATTPQQTPTDLESQDVVRITTNLVQVDVVVTKDGKPVTDLQAEDFEIFEDGKPQAITSFSYVSNVTSANAATVVSSAKSKDKTAPPIPPAKINLNDQRRTIALVIDDLGISFESMAHLRGQVKKFLAELSPNDLVAIIRTGGDVGALQQFTNDKRVLQSALDHIRWNPCSRAGINVFQPVGLLGMNTGLCSQSVMSGTLNSLSFIVKGMKYLPGRKSMILFTDYLPIQDQQPSVYEETKQPPGDSQNSSDDQVIPDSGASYNSQLQRIAEIAIRASVVIYGVDTRGLQPTGLTAADRVTFPPRDRVTPDQVLSRIINARSAQLLAGRAGSDLIAKQTGGFVVRNSNDFGLKDIMQDQEGYYLIGFRPAEETFDKRFHHIKAKLKRRGLTLRTRAGFYGFTDEQVRPTELSATDLMNKALTSPFGAKDIDVRLTSFFIDDPARGAVLRSFVYFNPRDLTFAEQPDGWRLANVEVKAMLFGDNGRIVGEQDQAGSLRYKGAGYERAMREGVTYSFDIPLKLRGAFQFRVAVRDEPTARIGAAGQFVEIPDLKNGRLALSGVVAREDENTTTPAQPNDQGDLVSTGPAVRRFRQGSNVSFAYAVYNPITAGRTAQLTQQIRLFRDGKVIFTGDPKAVSFEGQTDPQRITTSSRLQLGPALGPGDYVFQVIVTDSSDKQKPRVASQWIDFEVIN